MTRFWRYMLFGLIVLGSLACLYVIFMSPPDPGPIDHAAVNRIQELCGSRTDCEVALGDIFPGDWDTFYEFYYGVSQHDVSQVLGTSNIRVSDLQNIYVFTKHGRIVKKGYGDTGQGQPLAGEIEFSGYVGSDLGAWRAYPPSARFKVKTCSTMEGGKLFGPFGGTSYLLVLSPVRSEYTTECQMPSG